MSAPADLHDPAPDPAEERLMLPAEVAALFGVVPLTVIRWARKGQLEYARTPGGKYRFRASRIEALLRETR